MWKMGKACAGFWNLFAAKRHLFLTFCRCFRLAWRMLSPFNGGPNESIHSSLRIPSGYWIWRRNYSQLMWMADGNIVGYCWNAWHVWHATNGPRPATLFPPAIACQGKGKSQGSQGATGVSDILHWHLIMLHSAGASIICIPDQFFDAIPHSTNFGLKSK